MSLTPEELRKIHVRHHIAGYCISCMGQWPCGYLGIADELERLQKLEHALDIAGFRAHPSPLPEHQWLIPKPGLIQELESLRIQLSTYKEALEVAEKWMNLLLKSPPIAHDAPLWLRDEAGVALTQVRKALGKEK